MAGHGFHQVSHGISFQAERNTTVSANVVITAVKQLVYFFTSFTTIANNKCHFISVKLDVQ